MTNVSDIFPGVRPRLIGDPAWEEAQLLDRLTTFPVIHVSRPDGVAAAHRLDRKGVVDLALSDDERMLLVTLADPRKAGAIPWPGSGGESA
jgi:hypothetical protein